jgi:hypothetical protein
MLETELPYHNLDWCVDYEMLRGHGVKITFTCHSREASGKVAPSFKFMSYSMCLLQICTCASHVDFGLV